MKNSPTTKVFKAVFALTAVCLLSLAVIAVTPQPAAAADDVKVFVNGQEISFPDAKPFIDSNGRTQVPVRFVANALGGEVDWDPDARRVDIERGSITISMTIGVKEIVVLKVKKPMDTAPIIQESRTFVPLRFVSEGFGAKVEWNAATRTVYITDADGGGDKYKIGDFLIDIGPNDKVGLSTLNRLSVYKESGLVIGEGSDASNIIIQIQVDNPKTDIPKQREEAAALLKQCLSDKLVDEIMAYADQKQTRSDKLEPKDFKEGRYEIEVGGGFGPIEITIWID